MSLVSCSPQPIQTRGQDNLLGQDSMKSGSAVYDEPLELPAKMRAMKWMAKQDVLTPSVLAMDG
ncbi:MAG: hypothetical protein ACM3MK_00280 [Chitinophagales bacterium]